MNAATAIYSKLSTTAGITAIVGTAIRPEYQRGDLFPRIIYTVDNDEATLTHDGPSGLRMATITVQSMARTYAQALDIATAVKAALDWQSGTWGGVTVQKCVYKTQTEQELTPADLGEAGRALLISQTFDLWYQG